MTDEKKIEELLKAFYKGETSVEEETFLNEFFRQHHIPEKWHVDKAIFNALNDSDMEVPAGFPQRLEKTLNKHIESTKMPNIRNLYIKIGSMAAAVALCVGLFFVFHKPSTPTMVDTFTDPDEAAIIVKQALTLISSNLNEGLEPLLEIQENINDTNELLENLNLK